MIQVEQAGLLSSVQDGGRRGFQHLGVGLAGAADPLSHALANLLVGNRADAAALEFTLRGPDLRFARNSLVALGGASFAATVNGRPLPRWTPVAVPAGARVQIGRAIVGLRGALAVAGGIAVPVVLGSAATDLRGGFGGMQGRALRPGDELPLGPTAAPASSPCRTPGWRLPWVGPLPEGPPAWPLRLIPGPQWPQLRADARAQLLGEGFTVDARSDRMGLRLQGPALALEGAQEMVSAGVATGTLQLPPGGAPILLLADRQTTGGYPRLGELARVDLPWAAQLRPGDPLRFTLCTLEEAQAAWLARTARLAFLADLLRRERLRC